MSKSRNLLLLVLISPLFLSTSFAQEFPWDDFTRRTLKEMVSIDKETEDYEREDRVLFYASLFQSVIRVKYTGKSRPMSAVKRAMLKMVAQSLSVRRDSEEYATHYEQEMLFTENRVEYWLPVHKKDSAYIPTELKKGEEVDIYIEIRARVCPRGVCDWLFAVEEFRKPKVRSPK